MKDTMNTRELAKKLAVEFKLPRADRYDLFLREYDDQVEVLGWLQDPTADMNDYRGREMLFPKLMGHHRCNSCWNTGKCIKYIIIWPAAGTYRQETLKH